MRLYPEQFRDLLRSRPLQSLVACSALLLVGCGGSGDNLDAVSVQREMPAVLAATITKIVSTTQTGGRPVGAVDVIDRFGRADKQSGFLQANPHGEPIGDESRRVIELALASPSIHWVSSLGSSPDGPLTTIAGTYPEPVRLTVIVGAPVIKTSSASVKVETRCGRGCHGGVTMLLSRSQTGSWSVSGTDGGFIE